MRGFKLPWPTSRWWVLATVVVTVATVATTSAALSWGPPLWQEFTSYTREGVLLPGLFLTVLAAQLGQLVDPRSVVVGPTAPRSRNVINRHLGGLALVATLGHTIGIFPAAIITTVGAEAGSIDPLAQLSNYFILIAITFLAYLLSALLRTRWATIIAPAITLSALMAPVLLNSKIGNLGLSTRQTSIVWLNNFPDLGWDVTAQISLYQILFFAIVSVACVMTLQRLTAGGVAKLGLPQVGVWGVAALMAVVSVALSPNLVEHDNVLAACTQDQGLTVCVHPADESLTDQIIAAAVDVKTVVGPTAQVETLHQDFAGNYMTFDQDAWFSLGGVTSDSDLRAEITGAIVWPLTGGPSCQAKYNEHASQEEQEILFESDFIQAAISYAIHQRLGIPVETGSIDEATGEPMLSSQQRALTELSDSEFQNWITDNAQAIATCSVRDADLP